MRSRLFQKGGLVGNWLALFIVIPVGIAILIFYATIIVPFLPSGTQAMVEHGAREVTSGIYMAPFLKAGHGEGTVADAIAVGYLKGEKETAFDAVKEVIDNTYGPDAQWELYVDDEIFLKFEAERGKNKFASSAIIPMPGDGARTAVVRLVVYEPRRKNNGISFWG